jgi:hypothetical protein
MLAETATSRMVLTCTRKVRWSKCSALEPGPFTARLKNEHLEVLTLSEKNKEEWVKYDIDQQTPINAQDPSQLDDRGTAAPSAASSNEPQPAAHGWIDASSSSTCPTSLGASVFAEAYGGAQALGAIPDGYRVSVDLSRSTANFYWTEGTAFSDLFKSGSKLSGYVFRDCVRVDLQQTAINKQAPPKPAVQTAAPSLEAPAALDSGSEFPKRWKCIQNGEIHALRFHGDYIYAEQILTEADAKTGLYFLYEFKKDGDKYVGTFKGRVIDGSNSCPITFPAELTSVTKERIEGRMLLPQMNSKIDWNTCQWSTHTSWDEFSWIPVK